jgi:hypothetical protein
MEIPIEEPPRKAVLPSIASGATRQMDLSQTTIPSSVPTKPFDPAKKTWKKTGSEDSC